MTGTVLQAMITEEELVKLPGTKKEELKYLPAEKGVHYVQLSRKREEIFISQTEL